MVKEAIIILTVSLVYISPAGADMYRWVDPDGVTHYSDTRPKAGQPTEVIKTPHHSEPIQNLKPVKTKTPLVRQPLKEPQKISQKKTSNKPRHQVQIFTTRRCRWSKKALGFLKTHNIQYKQYDLNRDHGAVELMRFLGGTGGVPFAVINGKAIQGFTSEAYKQALGLR